MFTQKRRKKNNEEEEEEEDQEAKELNKSKANKEIRESARGQSVHTRQPLLTIYLPSVIPIH